MTSSNTTSSTSTDSDPTPESLERDARHQYLLSLRNAVPSLFRKSRNDWVKEMLKANPDKFYNNLRMDKTTFMSLVDTLTTRGFLTKSKNARLSVMDEVALFLRTLGTRHEQRGSDERRKHPIQTMSRHNCRVIKALNMLAAEVITLPNFNETHPKILEDPDLYPFFQGAVGAMDGTLMQTWGREGLFGGRNVLAICDFDLMFTYVYVGWEVNWMEYDDSATAMPHLVSTDPTFPFPPTGKYYLVHAGFANSTSFLTSYNGSRYDADEFCINGMSDISEPEELFNYRHNQLRNCVDRCFGMLKKRFPLLLGMPSYSVRRQVELIRACCVLHNFIRKESRDDKIFNEELDTIFETDDHSFYNSDMFVYYEERRVEVNSALRDEVANALWAYHISK